MAGLLVPRTVLDHGACYMRPGSWSVGGSSGSSLPRAVHKRKEKERRFRGEVCAQWGNNNVPAQDCTDRRRFLLKYVQEVEPTIMEQFADHAPAQVVDAFRTSVTGMIGTLPPQYFDVTIQTEVDNLAQLLYTVAMSGYMMRNAQYRLELSDSLDRRWQDGFSPMGLGPYTRSWDEEFQYAEGSQLKNVEGDVLKWHHDRGLETIPAAEYITSLEREIAWLRKQAGMSLAGVENRLLGYLKSLDADALQELTSCGDDVVEAINSFINRILGTAEGEKWGSEVGQFSATQISKILYFLMIVGYFLRMLEIRFDMEAAMLVPEYNSSAAPLPP